MPAKPRILFVGGGTDAASLPDGADALFDVVVVTNPIRAMVMLERGEFDALYVSRAHFEQALRFGRFLEHNQILEGMPDAVALVDSTSTILWTNNRLCSWAARGNVVGETFFSALGNPNIVGGDASPFQSAVRFNHPTSALLKTANNRYYHLHCAPLLDADEGARHLVVTVRDVTIETEYRQKLLAIQEAGRELAGLRPEEIFYMTVDERKELLKKNVLHYTQDLLHFDTVEIRLLDSKTNELLPLLEIGMDPEAAQRVLYAKREGNGVTGFVASSGKSYLCEDTTIDPLYLQGVKGAKSSLTVPLRYNGQTIGTFNVESPQPHGFSDSDMKFVETFCREIAAALNTLDLLSAQRANAAQESVELIHRAVALPIDEILSEACALVEQSRADRDRQTDPEVLDRLQKIVAHARDIKEVIQMVGRNMAPTEAVPVEGVSSKRPKLRGRRVLVVDGENDVRRQAHTLLEPYGVEVETAQRGAEAELLYQLSMEHQRYDVIVTGVKLPDMSGYDLMMRLKSLIDPVPLILTQESGCWDSNHTLVKARQAGLSERAWIVKPFKAAQLLDTVEHILDIPGAVVNA